MPPYMALARINEINKQMQSAQNKPQPPAEPLNQSLPKQAMQSMGIGALPQGAPPQGMPPQASPAQGMPPQGMPPQAPPQAPPNQMPQQGAQPVRMAADGGLMSLPVDSRMFDYGSGGVVAFGEGDLVEGQEGSEDADYDASAGMRELAPYIKSALKQQAPSIDAPSDIEKRLRESKEYGIDEGPIGKGYLEGLGSLKEAKATERAKKQADIEIRKKLASRKALADFSDATRGQTGLGGLNALTRSRIGSTEKFMEEEGALRDDAIKTDSLINEAQYKMQELRTAKLKGDVAGEYKAQADMAKIAKDLHVSQNQLMARLASGNLALLGKEAAAGAQVDSAEIRAKAKGSGAGKPGRTTDLILNQQAQAKLLRIQHPDWSDEAIEAEAFVRAKTMTITPQIQSREKIAMEKDWSNETYKGAYKTAEAQGKADEYRRDWERRWNPTTSPAMREGGGAPAATPAAPAGPAQNPIKIK